jgi:hypothetical protein
MLIPAILLGTYSEVRKNAKIAMKKVSQGFTWQAVIGAYDLLDTREYSFPISLNNESNKSEKMFYFNAFFSEIEKYMTPLLEPENPQSMQVFIQQDKLGNEVFSTCLESSWGVVALLLPFWGIKNRMQLQKDTEIFRIKWYFEFKKMRSFLMKVQENWEIISAEGQNYYGMPYQKRFFWEIPTRLQFSLLNLGVGQNGIDSVFGSIYEQMSPSAKTDISQYSVISLVTDALDSSKNFPDIGLQQGSF